MRKFIFSFMFVLASIVVANAQSQQNYYGNSKIFDNASIGMVGGVETNLHDWCSPQGAIVGIIFNKEITPLIGVTLEGNASINDLANWKTNNYRHVCCGNTFDGVSVYLAGRINLSNAIYGYNGAPRKIEVETNTGIGYGHAFHTSKHNGKDALLVKLGLNLSYNFTEAWTVTLRPAVVYNVAATNGFNVNHAVGQITAGVIYHFKTSNGTHSFNKAKLYDQSEIDALNEKVNGLQRSLDAANTQIKAMEEANLANNTVQTDTVYIEAPVTIDNIITFKINSAVVDETQMANLDKAARMLVNDDTVKVTLKGYADKNTGSTSYNQKLSEDRAEAVKKILLEKYGISSDRVRTLGVGDTEQLYSDNEWNRVVIFVEDK